MRSKIPLRSQSKGMWHSFLPARCVLDGYRGQHFKGGASKPKETDELKCSQVM